MHIPSLFLHTSLLTYLIACDSNTPDEAIESEALTEENAEAVEATVNSSVISDAFNLYHSRHNDSLNMVWYDTEVFSDEAAESGIFTGEWSISPEAEGTLEVLGRGKLLF